MKKSVGWAGTLLAVGMALGACERESKVQDEIEDLREAERDSPNVVRDLEGRLAKAKADVVKLEEQLAMARQGVTHEVLEERQELKEALNEQAKDVKEEAQEAQHAAQVHNSTSEVARRELEHTQPKEAVRAQVNTETQVTPLNTAVEVRREQTNIPVDSTQVVERTTDTPIDQAEIERRRAAERARSAANQP